MGVRDRLKRLEGDEPERCEEAPCLRGISTVETIVYPDGTRETVGGPLPPLCEACPVRRGEGPIRRVEVVRSYAHRHDLAANTAEIVSATVDTPNERHVRESTPLAREHPEAAGEHAEDLFLAEEMRRQQREDEAFEKERRRRRNRGTPAFRPEDFGL